MIPLLHAGADRNTAPRAQIRLRPSAALSGRRSHSQDLLALPNKEEPASGAKDRNRNPLPIQTSPQFLHRTHKQSFLMICRSKQQFRIRIHIANIPQPGQDLFHCAHLFPFCYIVCTVNTG